MPDQQLEKFSHLEFEVQVARRDKLYVARCYVGPGEAVERSAEVLEEVRRAIKEALNPLSSEFVGVEGAINQFRRAFPGGFESAFFDSYEGNYKEVARVFVDRADVGTAVLIDVASVDAIRLDRALA